MNQTIFKGIKKNLVQSGASGECWIEELPTVLWSLRTTLSHNTGETPFSLVSCADAVLPAKVGLPTWRERGFDEVQNSHVLKEQLNFIDELRDKALFTMQKYEHLMARSYNRRVKAALYELEEMDGKPFPRTWHASKLSKFYYKV
ncbi:hypothetical protein LIER_36537 [Lithospermum erythrorhizon]|uniref:Uncharacterized protein n=1 Tax=Lithospermum erythrorhizon TaxID=34254 RepID=A0AAV3P874_LITER